MSTSPNTSAVPAIAAFMRGDIEEVERLAREANAIALLSPSNAFKAEWLWFDFDLEDVRAKEPYAIAWEVSK